MEAFEEYQKEEYGRIAEAHFKTADAISSFFRYYLVIMALPLSILGVLATAAIKGDSKLLQLLADAKPILAFLFIVISAIGICIMMYVINLRLDALLYARTVNSIRKYFYDRAPIGMVQKLHLRQLPQNAFQPAYREQFFYPVVIAFALFNTFYFVLSAAFLYDSSPGLVHTRAFSGLPVYLWGITAAFFAGHVLVYGHLTAYRENHYLKRNSIGVDIDGVLNKHRQHFCDLFSKKGFGAIDPDQISEIPVHRSPGLAVSIDQEHAIFHDPEYWVKMPPDPDASHYLASLRNMGLRINLVSNRPWPRPAGASPEDDSATQLKNAWRKAAWAAMKSVPLRARASLMVRLSLRFARPIEVFTKCWLHQWAIPYDELLIEQGWSRFGPLSHSAVANRFQLARKLCLRFFVEDDWENATRLAFICDIVFLMQHPYNSDLGTKRDPTGKGPFLEPLPDNVIVVRSWKEIYENLRRMQ